MQKPIIVVTHERSGTHLMINCINYKNQGEFYTIGYNPESKTKRDYAHETYKDIISNAYLPNSVNKSHHQVEFAEDYLDFLFSKYKVIYVKRDVKDVLCSYYKFMPREDQIASFPKFEDWIFCKPDEIGREFFLPYAPDPHILIEPDNYIHRWLLHTTGWLKHQSNMLVVNYEDILSDYPSQKQKIENWIGKKIADKIPNVHDKSLPNFGPVKGVVGSHKDVMSPALIKKIDEFLLKFAPQETKEKR